MILSVVLLFDVIVKVDLFLCFLFVSVDLIFANVTRKRKNLIFLMI